MKNVLKEQIEQIEQLAVEKEYEALSKEKDSINSIIQDTIKLLSEKKDRKKIIIGVLADIQKSKKFKYFLAFPFEPLLMKCFKFSIGYEGSNGFLISHQGLAKELSRNKFISDTLLPEYVSFNRDLLTIEKEIESLEFFLRKKRIELDNIALKMELIKPSLRISQYLSSEINSVLVDGQPQLPKVFSIGAKPRSETL